LWNYKFLANSRLNPIYFIKRFGLKGCQTFLKNFNAPCRPRPLQKVDAGCYFPQNFYTFAVLFLKKAMYAIVNIAGKQFKVAKDQYIYAPKLEGEAGSAVSFDNVLLVDNAGTIDIGAPTVQGIKVSGKILEHVKGNKVIVFKKKRRKGYQVKNGHRQQFTKVQIESIG
jgi:large subunit ribosomal protein L21